MIILFDGKMAYGKIKGVLKITLTPVRICCTLKINRDENR